MWRGPGQDPGGTGEASSEPPSSQELQDLKDQFEQQQTLIAQLKEMLRKSEQTTVTPEKVEEYANTLSKMNARAKKAKLKKDSQEKSDVIGVPGSKRTIETPATEKMKTLRKQLEENKVKLAERGKNQKGLEQMVTQLKAQLDDSQQLISQTPLNLSLPETKTDAYSINSNPQELYHILVGKERRISDLTNKLQKLEANVIDLQENLKEKDSVIDARTKAITLMTENLSKKGKHTLDELDDTKEQMRKMQKNFVTFETQMKEVNTKLTMELEEKNEEILRLRSANIALENCRLELQATNTELQDKVESQEKMIDDLKQNRLSLTEDESTKEIHQLSKRITELEEVNASLKQSIADSPRNSPQRSSKRNKKGHKKIEAEVKGSELEIAVAEDKSSKQEVAEKVLKIEELNNVLKEKECTIEENKNQIFELEKTVENMKLEMSNLSQQNFDIEKENEEIVKLKKQIDDSNKNMIKAKAQHKAKIKELNKKIEAFKNVSDSNAELVKMETENTKLSHKILELEEEIGSLQLKLVALDNGNKEISADQMQDLQKKLEEQTAILAIKTELISSLELQTEEFKKQIHNLSERLEVLSEINNDQVQSEMTSIHFEEQVDKLTKENSNLLNENEKTLEKIELLKREKQELANKLDTYMQENIELIDKLEKLSAEKVSSAESIEIVESLTQQERLEIEAYQKHLDLTAGNLKTSQEHLIEDNPDLNDSVNQLTEETSELLQKIELFNEERKEVMEKMEILTSENSHLSLKIKEIENNRDILVETYEHLQTEKEELSSKLEKIENDNEKLLQQVNGLVKENNSLKETQHDRSEDETKNSEIEEYKALVELQKQELKELKVQLLSAENSSTTQDLNSRLKCLHEEYQSLLNENEQLKNNLKIESEKISEKDNLESELTKTREYISELEIKLQESINEIENYKIMINDNKSEIFNSGKQIEKLNELLLEKDSAIEEHLKEISRLESVVQSFDMKSVEESEKSQEALFGMSEQLETLKLALGEKLNQMSQYEKQLHENSSTIEKLHGDLKSLNAKILETEHLLESKDDEMKEVIKEKENKDNMIVHLKQEIQLKEEHFNQIINELKEKCLLLQTTVEDHMSSIEDSRAPLENKMKDLEQKNKEQLEKMRKIAVTLKKKNAAYLELEQKYTEISEKWEREYNEKDKAFEEKDKKIMELETKVHSLLGQFNDIEKELVMSQEALAARNNEYLTLENSFSDYKNINRANEEELEKLSKSNRTLSNELRHIHTQVEDLQNVTREYEDHINALSAENQMLKSSLNNIANNNTNAKDDLIARLQEEIETITVSNQTSQNALHAKMQELQLFIETQDTELNRYKERVNKLEEGLSIVEERRLSLEQKSLQLDAQLEEKRNEYDKVSEYEDILEHRLQSLMAHDLKIEKQLEKTLAENQTLNENIAMLTDENTKLKEKLVEKTNQMEVCSKTMENLEDKNQQLKKSVDDLEKRLHNLQQNFDKKVYDTRSDCDQMEIELQEQLKQFSEEKRSLLSECEHLRDQMEQYINLQETLKEELLQYEERFNHQQNEFAKKLQEYRNLVCENILLKTKLDNAKMSNSKLDNKSGVTFGVSDYFDSIKSYEHSTEDPHETKTPDMLIQIVVEENIELQKQLEAFQQSLHKDRNIQENALPSTAVFTWPDQTDDPFNFIANNPTTINQQQIVKEIEIIPQEKSDLEAQTTTSVDNLSADQLLEIIKTLESKLFIAEKQQQEAFVQCHQLSLELGNLAHGRDNSNITYDLASEIVGASETEMTEKDRKQLQNIEFAASAQQMPQVETDYSNMVPVEEMCDMQTAYTCQNDEEIINQEDINKQIIEGSVYFAKDDKKQLQSLEFSPVHKVGSSSQTSEPVKEDPCKSEQAYICHEPEYAKNMQFNAFSENDDGWGWGPEEAQLEQEHQDKTENAPENLKKQIENLKGKVSLLENERDQHLEEIKQSNIKSAKLLKKLKEFKIKYDQLAAQASKKSVDNSFGDLDDAIQEEFKLQIKNLEKALKELKGDLEKEKLEKEGLHKKADVLISANERLIEMKEKQDIEILGWQQKNRELQLKLSQMEWGEHDQETTVEKVVEKVESDASAQQLLQQINALNDVIKEITLDNEELQALLEEQRNLRIAAEKAKSIESLPIDTKTEAELLQILSQKSDLQQKLELVAKEKIKIEESLLKSQESYEALKIEHDNLLASKIQLEEVILQNNSDLDYLKLQVNNLSEEITTVQQINFGPNSGINPLEMASKIEELNDKIKQLTFDNEQLQNQLKEEKNLNIGTKNGAMENMKSEAEYLMLLSQKNELNDELVLVTAEKERLQNKLTNAVANEKELFNRIESHKKEITTLQFQLQDKDSVVEDMQSKLEILSYEINRTNIEPNEVQKLYAERNQYYNQVLSLQAELEEIKLKYLDNENVKTDYEKAMDENKVLYAEIDSQKAMLNQLHKTIETLQQVSQTVDVESAEINHLKEALKQKSEELQELSQKCLNMESEFEVKLYSTIEQLNQEWSVRVDQRGSDVAESWKLHVDSKETEFMNLEQQLRKDINDLEEKNNALINENNELRKNVDAEIRNEVDKMSALQKQINDRQQYINELTKVVQDKQEEVEHTKLKLTEYENVLSELNKKQVDKDSKINELENELVKSDKKVHELSAELTTLKNQLQGSVDQAAFIELQKTIDDRKSEIEKLMVELDEKKLTVEQNFDYTESLQKQLEDYRISYSVLEQQLNEKNLYINEIVFQKDSENKIIETLQQQNYDLQSQLNNANTKLIDENLVIEKLNTEIDSKSNELNHLKSVLHDKERELNQVMESRQQDHHNILDNQQQQYEELISRKDMQLIMLETQHEEKNLEIKNLLEEKEYISIELQTKQREWEEMQKANLENTALIEEENRQMNELREIIQSQVLKIEELNRELYDKSRDYDALIAEIDIRKTPQLVEQRNDVARGVQSQQAPLPEDDLAEPVSRAELDLAHYMLHQRDMRCEELTVELMQLLEERDTLQLKLSNSIRENEELRNRITVTDIGSSSLSTSSLTEAVSKSGVSAINLNNPTTSQSSIPKSGNNQEPLASKLSELKSLSYRKDKTLVDEQELRRLQQLSIMHQHMDEAAKLPAEAAARLVDASYTLSRDVQSPSKVLLNWLWGRSTPRVNDV